jgi:hypothetical protein
LGKKIDFSFRFGEGVGQEKRKEKKGQYQTDEFGV